MTAPGLSRPAVRRRIHHEHLKKVIAMGSGLKEKGPEQDTPTPPVPHSPDISIQAVPEGKDKYPMLPFPKTRPQEFFGAMEERVIWVESAVA